MDLFLKFLILGGKYLTQLTAQSIVEAYRRSLQLGRSLNLQAERVMSVVGSHDNMLEMYMKNLEEFTDLPNAHLAFISEYHRQEFECYTRDAGLYHDGYVTALLEQSANENFTNDESFVQQMATSLLGTYIKAQRVRTPPLHVEPILDNIPKLENVQCGEAKSCSPTPANNPVLQDASSLLSPRTVTVNAINMLKDAEHDTTINSVAEYLDRQAAYIESANNTFKQLQVDIANKYQRIRDQELEHLQEELARDRDFVQKLKAVQVEVETCTKLMKKAQDHLDVTEEDQKTKRLFGSIDKIIKDVEAITVLMQTNEEYFRKVEARKSSREQGRNQENGEDTEFGDSCTHHKAICNMLSQQIRLFTDSQQKDPLSEQSGPLVPISDNIQCFLSDDAEIQNKKKLIEVNQKAFEKMETMLNYPLIGRWKNHLKKSRKGTSSARKKDREKKSEHKGDRTTLYKKPFKFSKARVRSRLLSIPNRHSADELRTCLGSGCTPSWSADIDCSTSKMSCSMLASASDRLERRNIHESGVTEDDEKQSYANRPIVVDERLDQLVEQLLSNMNPTLRNADETIAKGSANPNDNLKVQNEVKGHINNVMADIRRRRTEDQQEIITFELPSIMPRTFIKKEILSNLENDKILCSEERMMFDGQPVDADAEFDNTVHALKSQVARAKIKSIDNADLEVCSSHTLNAEVGSARSLNSESLWNMDQLDLRLDHYMEMPPVNLLTDSAPCEDMSEPKSLHITVDPSSVQIDTASARTQGSSLGKDKTHDTIFESLQHPCSARTYTPTQGKDHAQDESITIDLVTVDDSKQLPTLTSPTNMKSYTEADLISVRGIFSDSPWSDPPQWKKIDCRQWQDADVTHMQVPRLDLSEVTSQYDDDFYNNLNSSHRVQHMDTSSTYGNKEVGIDLKADDMQTMSLQISIPSTTSVKPDDTRKHRTDLKSPGINTAAVMKDIADELNEKNALLEWKNKNTLLRLASEMNQAAEIKNKRIRDKNKAGVNLKKVLGDMFDKDENVTENSLQQSKDESKDNRHEVSEFARQTALRNIRELARNRPGHKLTVPRKYQANGNKKKWGITKKSKKNSKSYTVIKTKSNEITLYDMISGGSRMTGISNDKLLGTRQMCLNKNADKVLARIKVTSAKPTSRQHSKDIKLIPMMLLQSKNAQGSVIKDQQTRGESKGANSGSGKEGQSPRAVFAQHNKQINEDSTRVRRNINHQGNQRVIQYVSPIQTPSIREETESAADDHICQIQQSTSNKIQAIRNAHNQRLKAEYYVDSKSQKSASSYMSKDERQGEDNLSLYSITPEVVPRQSVARVSYDTPVVELARFQSASHVTTAPTSTRLKETTKLRRPEPLQTLRIKIPDRRVFGQSDGASLTSTAISQNEHTVFIRATPTTETEETVIAKSNKVANERSEIKDYAIDNNMKHSEDSEIRCAYDVKYKHDKPDVACHRDLNKAIDPIMKEAVESYHRKFTEETVKGGYREMGLVDKVPVRPQMVSKPNEDQSSLTITIEPEELAALNDASTNKKHRILNVQTRNQSSVSEQHIISDQPKPFPHLPSLNTFVHSNPSTITDVSVGRPGIPSNTLPSSSGNEKNVQYKQHKFQHISPSNDQYSVNISLDESEEVAKVSISKRAPPHMTSQDPISGVKPKVVLNNPNLEKPRYTQLIKNVTPQVHSVESPILLQTKLKGNFDGIEKQSPRTDQYANRVSLRTVTPSPVKETLKGINRIRKASLRLNEALSPRVMEVDKTANAPKIGDKLTPRDLTENQSLKPSEAQTRSSQFFPAEKDRSMVNISSPRNVKNIKTEGKGAKISEISVPRVVDVTSIKTETISEKATSPVVPASIKYRYPSPQKTPNVGEEIEALKLARDDCRPAATPIPAKPEVTTAMIGAESSGKQIVNFDMPATTANYRPIQTSSVQPLPAKPVYTTSTISSAPITLTPSNMLGKSNEQGVKPRKSNPALATVIPSINQEMVPSKELATTNTMQTNKPQKHASRSSQGNQSPVVIQESSISKPAYLKTPSQSPTRKEDIRHVAKVEVPKSTSPPEHSETALTGAKISLTGRHAVDTYMASPDLNSIGSNIPQPDITDTNEKQLQAFLSNSTTNLKNFQQTKSNTTLEMHPSQRFPLVSRAPVPIPQVIDKPDKTETKQETSPASGNVRKHGKDLKSRAVIRVNVHNKLRTVNAASSTRRSKLRKLYGSKTSPLAKAIRKSRVQFQAPQTSDTFSAKYLNKLSRQKSNQRIRISFPALPSGLKSPEESTNQTSPKPDEEPTNVSSQLMIAGAQSSNVTTLPSSMVLQPSNVGGQTSPSNIVGDKPCYVPPSPYITQPANVVPHQTNVGMLATNIGAQPFNIRFPQVHPVNISPPLISNAHEDIPNIEADAMSVRSPVQKIKYKLRKLPRFKWGTIPKIATESVKTPLATIEPSDQAKALSKDIDAKSLASQSITGDDSLSNSKLSARPIRMGVLRTFKKDHMAARTVKLPQKPTVVVASKKFILKHKSNFNPKQTDELRTFRSVKRDSFRNDVRDNYIALKPVRRASMKDGISVSSRRQSLVDVDAKPIKRYGVHDMQEEEPKNHRIPQISLRTDQVKSATQLSNRIVSRSRGSQSKEFYDNYDNMSNAQNRDKKYEKEARANENYNAQVEDINYPISNRKTQRSPGVAQLKGTYDNYDMSNVPRKDRKYERNARTSGNYGSQEETKYEMSNTSRRDRNFEREARTFGKYRSQMKEVNYDIMSNTPHGDRNEREARKNGPTSVQMEGTNCDMTKAQKRDRIYEKMEEAKSHRDQTMSPQREKVYAENTGSATQISNWNAPRSQGMFAQPRESAYNLRETAHPASIEESTPYYRKLKFEPTSKLKDRQSRSPTQMSPRAEIIERKSREMIKQAISATKLKERAMREISPLQNKNAVDLRKVQLDTIRSGSNIQYLMELSSNMSNKAYANLLAKCYPEEKKQLDATIIEEKKPKTETRSKTSTKESPKSPVRKEEKQHAKSILSKMSKQQLYGYKFEQNKENFIDVQQMTTRPMIKTFGKLVQDNLKEKQPATPHIPIKPREEVKRRVSKINLHLHKNPFEKVSSDMQLKGSERERNLKRLIIMDEKLKKLETNKHTRNGDSVTLYNILEDIRVKKESGVRRNRSQNYSNVVAMREDVNNKMKDKRIMNNSIDCPTQKDGSKMTYSKSSNTSKKAVETKNKTSLSIKDFDVTSKSSGIKLGKLTAEVTSAKGPWKMPISKKKNMLPNVPELKNMEVVTPKSVAIRYPSPVKSDINPPPYRERSPIAAHYSDEPHLSPAISRGKPEKYLADKRLPTLPPASKPSMPYALKYQRKTRDTDEKITTNTQFDEQKSKDLKFFQGKAKKIQETDYKYKQVKLKPLSVSKKSIHPYTNTFGRHLVRLQTDSDRDGPKLNSEEYQRALEEKLQKMSALPRVKHKRSVESGYVYRPPIDKGGIRDFKKPSLAEVKQTILKHLKASSVSSQSVSEGTKAHVH